MILCHIRCGYIYTYIILLFIILHRNRVNRTGQTAGIHSKNIFKNTILFRDSSDQGIQLSKMLHIDAIIL